MKLAKPWALAAIVALSAVPAAAETPTPDTAARKMAPPAAADPKIAFERFKLPNGVEVILSSDRTVPLVAVNVWYHVGSGYEVVGKSGFAHLFEHMMFQGSKHVPEDKHFDVLKKIGASDVNGTTNSDRTNYFEVVPSNQLETALWLESDRMGFLLDKLTVDSLKNQIEVVRNERRQRYDNIPYGKARFARAEALYPEGHPYRYMTIGKHEDLERASVDDVGNFFRTWYIPSNATLCVVGDFDMAEGKQLVEKWFGKFPKSAKPGVVPVPAPVLSHPHETLITDDPFAKLTQISFSWHSPAAYAPGDAALDIAGNALAAEGTGRLYKALVYGSPIAQSVRADQSGSQFSGVFEITVTLRSDSKASIADVKKVVFDEVAKLAKEPLSQKEIDRVVAANESNTIRSLETVFGRSQTLQEYNHFLGDPDRISWDLDRYRKATPDEIRNAVASYLQSDKVVTIVTQPAPKGGK